MSEKLFDRDAEQLRDLFKKIRARNYAGVFPKTDVGAVNAKLFGEFTLGKSGCKPQSPEALAAREIVFLRHERTVRLAGRNDLHDASKLDDLEQCNLA